MVLFVDLDILLKLSACGLLYLIRDTNEYDYFIVSRTFIHTLRTNKGINSSYSEHTRQEVRNFLEQANSITPQKLAEKVKRELSILDKLALDAIDGIDDGEAALFAATGLVPDFFYLCTGDKKALRKLAENREADGIKPIFERNSKRCIRLEKVLYTGLVNENITNFRDSEICKRVHKGCIENTLNDPVFNCFREDKIRRNIVINEIKSSFDKVNNETHGLLLPLEEATRF